MRVIVSITNSEGEEVKVFEETVSQPRQVDILGEILGLVLALETQLRAYVETQAESSEGTEKSD